ncbi:aminotransferase class I/II-fold pyridoxal phosphate-dependent enzyme [Streptomyces blastmyceticus]
MMGSATGERNDIAIVGMACRFPGARNVNEYWRLLTDPRPQFDTVPGTRWRKESFVRSDLRDTSSTYTDKMALLEDVDQFDAKHYKIPPRRARAMDPQHRLLIDLAREAIQDAGWEVGGFDAEETAVIMSLSDSGYRDISALHIRLRQLAGGEFGSSAAGVPWQEAARAVDGLHGTSAAGLLLNMGPNTVSSVFGLHGESYALDAACSGGMMAVANAVFALRAGRCRIALAGGAQLLFTPDLLVGLCRIGAISPSGRCLPFGAEADGFVLAEGGGVLVLRPLADARAAGDRVYAVIRGVGTANDGTTQGGMYPEARGQLRALRRAYSDADLTPNAVGYLEAHGTGTTVGDRIEVSALRELRGEGCAPAYLGAVKAIVGHSLGAAGIAGLVKATLAVQKGKVPPQPSFEVADHLGLEAAGLTIPKAPADWGETGQPRRAGVSAFGFGGTDIHIVLEGAVEARTRRAPAPGPHLLVLSARDRAALARYARDLAHTIVTDGLPLDAVASTLAHRAPLPEGLAVVADAPVDAFGKLTAAAAAIEARRTGDLGTGLVAGAVPPDEPRTTEVTMLGPLAAEERAAVLTDLARNVVTGSGPRPLVERTPLCTLPPSPLSPGRHWVVDEKKRKVTAAGAPATAPALPVPNAAERATEARPDDTSSVAAIVLEEVSRTSVFPVSDLTASMALGHDLGFDSLMLHELQAGIRKRIVDFPDEGMLSPDLTVQRLIAMADGRLAGAVLVPSALPHGEPGPQWSVETARVDDFPEVEEFERRLRSVGDTNVPNPYFRVHQGNIRRTTTIEDREYLSFSGYNYLGLSGHPTVRDAVCEAVERYGTSVSASRPLAGERELTLRLERTLADLLGVEDCLVLVSGHATNVTAIGHVVGAQDLVVHDELAHDSILQGCALSGAARRPFAHNELDQLEHILSRNRSRFRRVLIAVEGAYSMDGDLVDLPGVVELKKRYGTLLLIDEAHSIGTVGQHGRGVGEFFGVDRGDVDLWMGTLSKALASCGGYLGGSARMVRWLRHTLPGFVYSVGLTPANAAAALAATELISAEPHRIGTLQRNAKQFLDLALAAGLPTGSSRETPIVPCIIGDSDRTLRVADRLFRRGVVADPIFHPAVEENLARLRFFVTSEHTEQDIQRTVSILSEELEPSRS